MEVKVKLFATLRLNLKIGMVNIQTGSSVSILELLELVSQKLNSNIISELIENEKVIVGTIILIDGVNILHLNKLDTIIDKDCTVSVFPPNGGG
ncbi:MAG: hypothetical protein AB7S48_13305 [Bacteroidales bacterium]